MYKYSNENILEEIIQHYKNPKHKGVINNWDIRMGADNPLCGDDVTIYLSTNNGVIEDSSFEGRGCSISQGCAEMMCDRIIGMKKDELSDLQFDLFNLEESPISKSRYKCATLALRALQGV